MLDIWYLNLMFWFWLTSDSFGIYLGLTCQCDVGNVFGGCRLSARRLLRPVCSRVKMPPRQWLEWADVFIARICAVHVNAGVRICIGNWTQNPALHSPLNRLEICGAILRAWLHLRTYTQVSSAARIRRLQQSSARKNNRLSNSDDICIGYGPLSNHPFWRWV